MKTVAHQNMELNLRVAEALGWTQIFSIGTSLVGRPPEGSAHSRDQAAVPNWAGDFNDCLKLGLKNEAYPSHGEVLMYVTHKRCDEGVEKVDIETAYRHVMLQKVLHKIS